MSKRMTRPTARVLSMCLVLALLVLVSGFSSAQTRDVSTYFAQEAKLTASDGAAEDYFGGSVSISGGTVVVGASSDDDNGEYSGSAYVFERDEGGTGDFAQVAKLTASDGAEGDVFGVSVSISGDTVLVGAQFDDDNGDDSGSAYVFEKPTAGWTDMFEMTKLTVSDGAAGDYFGGSVSISGDTVVVGARFNDDPVYKEGSAYVFERDAGGPGNWGQVAKLTASDGAPYERFGGSVSISGDTVVAGANWDDGSGSAYVFEKPGTGWTDMAETAKLTASDGAADDRFGTSAAISGDTVVVCASPLGGGSEDSGSAYVFEKPGAGWTDMTETAKLTASDGVAGDWFGMYVSISGDAVVVSAYADDDKGDFSGSAYLFEKPETGWTAMTETSKLTASDGAAEDHFGGSVSISGDTVVVGASWDDDNGSESGSAYVFGPFEPVTWVYLPVVLRGAP